MDEIIKATITDAADLTVDSWQNINIQLNKGASLISEALDDRLREAVFNQTANVTAIDEQYLVDIIKAENLNISTLGIKNLFVAVNNNVVIDMVNRIYADSYTFSERIWRVGKDYQEQVKRVITSGIAANRDVIDIAKDLEVYVQEGRKGIVKRYGDLIKGNRDYVRRIRKDIDYNALRIVRSELYASLQSVSIRNGIFNPACTGMYEWIRQSTTDWGCDCPDNAANSPYTLNNIPSFPHPNCLCIILPVLKPKRDFVKDLVRWSQGETVGYLDEWNKNYFQFLG